MKLKQNWMQFVTPSESVAVTTKTSLPRGKVSEMEISYLDLLKTGPNWFLVTEMVRSAWALLLG